MKILLGLLFSFVIFAATTITVSPGQTIGQPVQVTPPCGTKPGTYPITFTATDVTDSTHTGSATVNVSVVALGVTITSPLNNSTVKRGSTVVITATTPSVPRTGVAFYIGTAVLSTVAQPPYTTTWKPNKNGIYSIKAVVQGYCSDAASTLNNVTVVTK